MRELSSCRWVDNRHNVICIGKTGCGKSYLGAALAHAACRHGHSTLYTPVPRLMHQLAIARADGSYSRLLARIAKHTAVDGAVFLHLFVHRGTPYPFEAKSDGLADFMARPLL